MDEKNIFSSKNIIVNLFASAAHVAPPKKRNPKTLMTQTHPLFFLLLPILLFSHPGKTDKNGGHYDKKTGQYHYHNKPDATKVATAPAKTENDSATDKKTSFNRADSAGINERINAYFRKANENVGVLDCDVKIYERNLPVETNLKST